MIAGIVVIGLVTLAGLWICWPVIAGVGRTGLDVADVDPLDEALDRSLQAIEEIEFDHATGHLADDDFRELDAEERARALALIRRRDLARDGEDTPA